MNETVIEAQARYLIEDRIHPTRRTQSIGVRRRHRRLLLSSQARRSRLNPLRRRGLSLDKVPRLLRRQLNNHHKHLLLPLRRVRHEHTAL